MNITLYLRDDLGIYTEAVEVDKYHSVPTLSTTIHPPQLIGGQVAQWNGNGWNVLSERPALKLPSKEELDIKKSIEEKEWVDSELKASDYMAPITDHQYYYAYVVYRQQLRDYLVATEFPNGVRPILDKTIKNSLTKYQFMSRFTATERITMETASSQSPELADWVTLFKLTEEINLGDPNTIAGVTMLETVGIIGTGRAAEILS
jgi:hypothetical protein